VAARHDAFRVGHDGAVVEEEVDVVLRREQGADVAVDDEVRAVPVLDRLLDLGSVSWTRSLPPADPAMSGS
jgi:hypothetical protein